MIGRNELCLCNSGKKYKNCHLNKSLKDEIGYSIEELHFFKMNTLKIVTAQVELYEKRSIMLQHYPDYQTILKDMYKVIESVKSAPIKMNSLHQIGDQTYGRIHHSGFGDIQFTWSIPPLDQIVSTHKMIQSSFDIEELMKFIDVTDLSEEVLSSAEHNHDPVYIITYHSQEMEQWAVDGNHRIAARYNKSSTIKGYLFSEEQHISAMLFDYMKVAYSIRTNLNRMYDYAGIGPTPKLLPLKFPLTD